MANHENLVGQSLGQYQVLDELGRGGMAVVYKAWQPSLRREIALKVLLSQWVNDAEFIQRFRQEAIVAANLNHPHIVTIYEVGQTQGYIFIAMQYVQGRSLEDLILSQRSLSLERTIRILRPVAEALDFAHERRFLHRDIKPANILLTDDERPFITDFGIAKALEGSGATAKLTRAGTVLGTPAYMSPEQIQDLNTDYRSDLYSLGIVAYEMLGGRVPFEGTTTALIYAQVNNPPPSITQLNPSLPGHVEGVLSRMLFKDPSARFQSAGAFVDALADLQEVGQVAKTAVMSSGFSEPPVPSMADQHRGYLPPNAPSDRTGSSAGGTDKRRRLGWLLGIVGGIFVLLALFLGGYFLVRYITEEDAQASGGETASVLPCDIVFHSDRDGDDEVYLWYAETEELTQLTDNQVTDIRPDCSPDGEYVAFQSERDSNMEIYSLERRDSGVLQRLTENDFIDMKPVWSPDGQTIAFESDRDGNPELYLMNSDGTNVRRLTNNDASDWAPSWSPDGSEIAFMSNRDVGKHDYQIYVMAVDGSNIRRLTSNEFDDRVPSWSPDGNYIAFVSDRPDGEDWDIYVMSAEGEDVVVIRLTKSPGNDQNPSWTPNSGKILFDSDREGNRELYVMHADGSNQQRLTENPSSDMRPRCCP